MTPEEITRIVVIAILAMISSFVLGWDIAENRERRASRRINHELLRLQIKQHDLTIWVQKNWPNEFAAYRSGHTDGYQQGVLHSETLETMDNPDETPA